MTDKGVGILCEEYDHELAAEIDARLTPEEREVNAERAAAGKFVFNAVERHVEEQQKQAEAGRLQPELDAIDAGLAPYLKKELAEENAAARISSKVKRDFARFQKCCAQWELPHLPAPPQAVAVFLVRETEHGAAHVARLCRSISTVHRAVGFADPTLDVLVRAVVRLMRTNKPNPPPTKEKE
jgi:hypothetical protein